MMSRSSKGRWVVLLTVMMVFGVAGNAAAHGTVDQGSESGDGISCLMGHTRSLAQTFTPTADNLTGVAVHMSGVDSDSRVELTIRSANPADNPALARVANIPLSEGWNHIDLADPIDLTPGTKYAIRLDKRVGDPCWVRDNSRPYDGGQGWHDGGYLETDFNFWTYYEGDGADKQPPVADPNGPYSVAEGSAVTLNGSASSDPDDGDVLTFAWSPDTYLDDTSSATPEFTGVDDALEILTLTVTDPSGATDSNTAEVTVTNVAPTVGAITGAPVGSIPVGTTVTLAAAFTDPGTADTHVATWSWDDGSDPVTSPASSSILYDTAGVYSETVTVTVTDKDGGSDTATLELVAVVGDLKERKQAVRDQLADLSASLDDKDAKKLEKALRHLDKSLTAKYWVDGDTLVAKDGKKVFDEESKAVKDLEKIKNTDVSEAIASLVAIDEVLAQGAIKDAQDRYDDLCDDPTTRECEKAAKELDKAQKELDKAQKELDKGHFAHAIGKYKKAWEKADKALKELLKLDLGGDA